jgi:hypothetical protein
MITDCRAGAEVEHRGAYVKGCPPRRPAFTLSVPKHSSVATTVTIDVVPTETGWELTPVREGVPPERARQA